MSGSTAEVFKGGILIVLTEGDLGSLHSFHEVVLREKKGGIKITIVRDPSEDEPISTKISKEAKWSKENQNAKSKTSR